MIIILSGLLAVTEKVLEVLERDVHCQYRKVVSCDEKVQNYTTAEG